MRYFTFICLLAILAALSQSQAAPAPKPTHATPAVIKAGTEVNLQWVQERVVSYAHIAILQDKKVAELAIVRRHLHDPKDTKELISWLEKNFRIERVKGKNLVRVSFRDGNAKEQAAIINLVVDYFLKNQVGSRLDHLTKVLKSEEDIKKREEYIRTFPVLVEHAKAR